MGNYTKLAIKGVSTVLIISLTSALVGYFVRFTLARNLSVEDFGLFYAVFSFLGMIGLFMGLGIDKALIKFIPEFLTKKKLSNVKSSIIITFSILLITNTITIIGIFLFSNSLAQNYFHTEKAVIVLRLMSIVFFINSLLLALRYSFQSFKKMTYFAAIDLLRMLLILSIIFFGFKSNYGILLPIAAYLISPIIILTLFSIIFFKKVFPEFISTKARDYRKNLKSLFKYGIFVIVTNIGLMILGYTDSLTLTYFTGIVNVGLYSVAFPTANALSYFPKSITSIVLPVSSELWAKKKKSLLSAGLKSVYKYSIILILPCVLILFCFSELIISTFFGPKYLPASGALKILSIAMLFPCIYGPNSAFFSGIGKPHINSKIVYTAASFNLVSNIILVPRLGIIGAAITTTFSVFLMALIGSIRVNKFISIKFPLKSWLKTILIGIIFAGSISLLKNALNMNIWIETIIIVFISGAVYIALIFALKVINMKELKTIFNQIIKK